MHIVIVGGGFAGVKAALELAHQQTGKITLISNSPNFACHATLYSVLAGGGANQDRIALTDIFANVSAVEVVVDEITSIQPDSKTIKSKKHTYDYDKLILATGVVPYYHDIKGAKDYTHSLRSAGDIASLQKWVYGNNFSSAVVIGGGPAGVEFAGALSEWFATAERDCTVTLIDGGQRILPTFSKTASKLVAKKLTNMGVQIRTDSLASEVKPGYILVNNGTLKAELVVWAAGETLPSFYKNHSAYFNIQNHKIKTSAFLEAYEDIYAIGDIVDASGSGTAPGAMAMAKYVSDHIIKTMTNRKAKPYKYNDSYKSVVNSIPIGRDWAYVEQSGVYVSGKIGALTRRQIERDIYLQVMPKVQALEAWNSR